MQRPYTTIQILSSLNGRIDGPFFGLDVTKLGSSYFGQYRSQAHADAWLYGTTTVKEFTQFHQPDLAGFEKLPVPDGDFIAPKQAGLYFVSLDPLGEIGWMSKFYERPGREKAQIIEVLTSQASKAYRAYLVSLGISYIVLDSETLDARQVSEKLYSRFGIEKMLICGGGITDWTFLAAGIVDELSMILIPGADGDAASASVFECAPGLPVDQSVSFALKDVEKLKDGILHLVYTPNHVED